MSQQGITESERQMFFDMLNRNWKLQALAHRSPSPYNLEEQSKLEELSMSLGCGIGLWGFLSGSPRLRVLSIYHNDHPDLYELPRLNDLMKSFRTKDILPNLQHLDVCIYRVNGNEIPKVLESVRCLRSFQCHRTDALWSISDFRPHFSTVTTIDIQYGKPEFWQKVMSSCPALVNAKEVVLFVEDIMGREVWASTGLESLDLNVFVRSKGNQRSSRKVQEDALFRRIAKLVKLNHLSVHTGWREERTLHDQSWEALLRIKTLTSVELGYELTANRDMLNVMRRFFEMQKHVVTWTEAKMSLSPPEDAELEAENALLQALSANLAAIQN